MCVLYESMSSYIEWADYLGRRKGVGTRVQSPEINIYSPFHAPVLVMKRLTRVRHVLSRDSRLQRAGQVSAARRSLDRRISHTADAAA